MTNKQMNEAKTKASKLFKEMEILSQEDNRISSKLSKIEDRAEELYHEDEVTEMLERNTEYMELIRQDIESTEKIRSIRNQLFEIALSIIPAGEAKIFTDNDTPLNRIKVVDILKKWAA